MVRGLLVEEPIPLTNLEDQVVRPDDKSSIYNEDQENTSYVSNVSHKEYDEHHRYLEAENKRLTTYYYK